jgi:hypothetical protein
MIVVSVISFFFPMLSRILKVGIYITFGLICWIPFIMATAISGTVDSETKWLPAWIEVEHGDASKLNYWSLFCAVAVVICSTVASIVF